MLNKAMLIGNVGQDPEIRFTSQDKPIVSLSLATTESFKDRTTGERRVITQWHKIVIFNENLCRIAQEYVKKGSKIYVEGSIKTRTYTDKNGKESNVAEIVLGNFDGQLMLLDKVQKNEPEPISSGHTQPRHTATVIEGELDDEVPF